MGVTRAPRNARPDRRSAVATYSVEHGREDPLPYLRALAQVLDGALVRRQTEATDATAPAA